MPIQPLRELDRTEFRLAHFLHYLFQLWEGVCFYRLSHALHYTRRTRRFVLERLFASGKQEKASLTMWQPFAHRVMAPAFCYTGSALHWCRWKVSGMFDSLIPQECRVALLVGGTSGEREVSLASGEGARTALEEAGFPVTVLDPANKEDLKRLIDGPFEVAFICLHGRNGEDGTLQGFLEVMGLPYIGSGVWASALAMNKAKAKMFYASHGIPTPPSVTLGNMEECHAEEMVAEFGERCVVKPVGEGSALGVSIVKGADAVREAVRQVLEQGNEALVEPCIAGRELTVAVLGNADPRALPVIEIVPQGEFYDYDSKYAPGGSKHLCPAPLTEAETEKVQALAVRAHCALECEGVSRSDFILDDEGNCWILETNTIPGMTGTSLLPDAARAAGISFAELCKLLIGYALEK